MNRHDETYLPRMPWWGTFVFFRECVVFCGLLKRVFCEYICIYVYIYMYIFMYNIMYNII